MPFGLKNTPVVFSIVVVAAFKEFIHKFLEVYLDDCTMFSLLKVHIEVLRIMLDRCRQCQSSLNLKKCIFCAPFGILLGHVVCKQGLLVVIQVDIGGHPSIPTGSLCQFFIQHVLLYYFVIVRSRLMGLSEAPHILQVDTGGLLPNPNGLFCMFSCQHILLYF
jgi:hypothetical protein